jgi:hypothetical protein
MQPETASAHVLLSAKAVRERARHMLALAMQDRLQHFRVDASRLDATADLVIATTRENYPTLAVPLHSRWRHFVVAGEDRFAAVARTAHWPDRSARARATFDLAIVSVLLDAGAGARWRYRDAATGTTLGGSEGLALAILDMFSRGVFSENPNDPLRADAGMLAGLTADTLRAGLQIAADNPLAGWDGRLRLLHALGRVVAQKPEMFAQGDTPRPGGLFDRLAQLAGGGAIAAPAVLAEILHRFGTIWPSRFSLGGVPLGDCWRHPAMAAADAGGGFVPFHKLSQWLAYSLVEPLQQAGFTVTDLDGLTGLAEYRNGGLFVDTGALALRDANDAARAHAAGDPLVVEWRALTVALLDELATAVRSKLNIGADALPLAKILQGGTWAAGRAIARTLRADGAPPINVVSDGTVF